MKRAKRHVYHELTRTFGQPTTFSTGQRTRLLILLGGWLRQETLKGSNSNLPLEISHNIPRRAYLRGADGLIKSAWHKHAGLSETAARRAIGYKIGSWLINPIIRVSKDYKSLPLVQAKQTREFDYIESVDKTLSFTVSVLYHKIIKPHGIERDGRKIVQYVTDHRSYPNKDVWRCKFWDFSSLGRDKASWQRATHHDGYVVKTDTGVVVVDTTLYKATQIANKRVVKTAIESIEADLEEQNDED